MFAIYVAVLSWRSVLPPQMMIIRLKMTIEMMIAVREPEESCDAVCAAAE